MSLKAKLEQRKARLEQRKAAAPPNLEKWKLAEVAIKQQAQEAAQLSPKEDNGGESAVASNNAEPKQKQKEDAAKQNATMTGPLQVDIDGRSLAPMITTLREARRLDLPDTASTYAAAPTVPERPLFRWNQRALEELSSELARDWERRRTAPSRSLVRRLEERAKLPVMAEAIQTEILSAVKQADVLVVRANTGSGKTTQIPQIILDHETKVGKGAFCNIAITQPRRISATSVARRVAQERDESLGNSVGFQIRFSSLLPKQRGGLLYCTTGLLLRQLRSRHDLLEKYSHLIIDEVHERSVYTDCILTLLRDLITVRKAQGRPYPKLILMSATVDSELFINYFKEQRNGVVLNTMPLQVHGRQFPVETHYLTDFLPKLKESAGINPTIKTHMEDAKDGLTPRYIQQELDFAKKPIMPAETKAHALLQAEAQDDEEEYNVEDAEDTVIDPSASEEHLMTPLEFIAATILHVLQESTSGDVLVFLVGLGDIDKIADQLSKAPGVGEDIENGEKLRLFKLHSSLAETNDAVFEDVPSGCRRLILATNIAETSITLPEVVHVIDTGKVRQRYYDPLSRMDTYPSVWVSKASQKQREGRAGRVRPGQYYALFTRERRDSFENTTRPELTRMDLVEPCLAIKASSTSAEVREFLTRAPSPPTSEGIDVALGYLEKLGALTPEEKMTPLGRLLANVPIHPSMMRAALLGILFQCLEPMLIIACTDVDDPLVSAGFGRGKLVSSRRVFAAGSESDILAQVNAFKEYELAERAGDTENMSTIERDLYVHVGTYKYMSRVARQVCEELSHAGLLPYPDVNRSVFASIPPVLNKKAGCVPLLKALSMNLFNSDIASRKGRSARQYFTADQTRALVESRSINHDPWKEKTSGREVPKPGDLMSYLTRRQDSETPAVSWIAITTMITPLIAAIFGRSLQDTGSGLLLNNWLEMQLAESKEGLKASLATRVLVEFRKAFERFCILAFTDLEEAARQAQVKSPLHKSDILPTRVREEMSAKARPKNFINRELRDVFVKGVVEMLEADEKVMKETFARDIVENEQRKQEEEAEAERKKAAKQRVQMKNDAAKADAGKAG